MVFLPYFTVMNSVDCFHQIPGSNVSLMLECFLTRMLTQINEIFFDTLSYHTHYLLLRGNCNHFNCILVCIGPLIICSVDVSGRREMRSFFNGIVRLQVCTTWLAISFHFCFCKSFFPLSMLLLPAMPLVYQIFFVPVAVTSFCHDCP